MVHPDRSGEALVPRLYWDPVQVALAGQADPLDLSDADATGALDTILREAVRLRSYADVPIGAFLSGGIDSSVVVALMQAQSRLPVKTFTMGYLSAEYDESTTPVRSRPISARITPS